MESNGFFCSCFTLYSASKIFFTKFPKRLDDRSSEQQVCKSIKIDRRINLFRHWKMNILTYMWQEKDDLIESSRSIIFQRNDFLERKLCVKNLFWKSYSTDLFVQCNLDFCRFCSSGIMLEVSCFIIECCSHSEQNSITLWPWKSEY